MSKGLKIHLGFASTMVAKPENTINAEVVTWRTLWVMGSMISSSFLTYESHSIIRKVRRNLFAREKSPVPLVFDDITALLQCERERFPFTRATSRDRSPWFPGGYGRTKPVEMAYEAGNPVTGLSSQHTVSTCLIMDSTEWIRSARGTELPGFRICSKQESILGWALTYASAIILQICLKR